MSSPATSQDNLRIANALADAAASHSLRLFRTPLEVIAKADESPVTQADRAAEAAMREILGRERPADGIYGEEHGLERVDAASVWVLDPIDGTRSFITGSPLWGTLIGLTRREEPLFGLLVQPVLEEVFFGGPSGSWLIKAERRDRLKSRACKSLAKAMLGCTHPDMFTGQRAKAFRSVSTKCLLTRFGGDCYNYAMVAAGYLDLVIESQLKPYDIVPLIPILERAGCVVTDWQGKPPLRGGDVVVAGSRELHKATLAQLQQ
jgi:inositol-phosphate phosphatase/L-galactose 1-phosphate phosphatase/histidinol-phosphatase